jgi:Fe-S oxidoreductase
MLTDKLDELRTTNAQTVVCNEAGCGLHLTTGAEKRGATLRCKHLAELLAESLELMEPG